MTQRRNQRRDLCLRETQNIPCSLMSFNSCFSVVLCSSIHAPHAFLRSRNDPTVGKDDMTKRAEIKVVSYLAEHSVSLYCFNHYRYVQRCCARFLKIIQRMALKKTKGTKNVLKRQRKHVSQKKNCKLSYGNERSAKQYIFFNF